MNAREFELRMVNAKAKCVYKSVNNLKKISSFSSLKRMVSSRNCRWLIPRFEFLTAKFSMILESSPFESIQLRKSTTKVNKKGGEGSLCLRPYMALILPLGFPLVIMEKLVDEIKAIIHFLHVSPKPLKIMMLKNSQSAISNAFSMSSFSPYL